MQQAPTATRAAVSRALARSSTLRTSSNPYFCAPTRSACPGRGRVRRCAGIFRALDRHEVRVLRLELDVRDRDGHRGARGSSRGERPSGSRTGRPRTAAGRPGRSRDAAGQLRGDLLRDDAHPRREPLQTATSAFPWDSPAVSIRNMPAIIGNGRRRGRRVTGGGGPETRPPPRRRPLPPWADRRDRTPSYLDGTKQSVKDSSPNRNVAQLPGHVSQLEVASRERRALGRVVDDAVDLDRRMTDAVGRERVDQHDL